MASKTKQSKEENVKLKKVDKDIIEEGYEYAIIPPDGGFGWVIALAAMMCNMVCDGTLFAFGVMKSYLQDHFQCSDMLILMVGSVPCGVYLLVGPIVSGLANRYGCRPIIIIGSIGAAACMVLSTLSPNVWAMMIIYGIFGGIFFGMVYLPSVVMVSFYFDTKRNIANGLVTAGTGIGALSFGPLANVIMAAYGWKIGMLVFAAIMLTGVLFGAIMRPLEPQKVPIVKEIEMESPMQKTKTIDDSPPPSYMNVTETNEPLLPHENGERVSHPATVPVDNPDVTIVDSSSSPQNKSSRIRTVSATSRTSSINSDRHRAGVSNPEVAGRPLYKKDALFTGSKKDLHRGSRTSLHSNPYVASVTNIPAALNAEEKNDSAFKAFADILVAMTDFSILKNKQLLMICIGNIFSMLGYYLPIMCLVSFAIEDMKVDKKAAAYLLSFFGASNTIGRFVGGPIAMIPGLNALRVHNALLFVAGALTVLAAYANSFFAAALYATLCGFAIAPHMSLLPSVICDCVGLDRYTTAFGILFLFRGVTSIIGPPAAGFLKDYTKKYDLAFIIGGTMIIIAAFFHIALVFFEPEKIEKEEEENKNETRTKVVA